MQNLMFSFKRNQLLKRVNLFTENKSKTKQLDVYDKINKIIIEFDGIFHFKNILKWNQLENVSVKDLKLNSLKNEFCIIRVGYDQFSYRKLDYGFKKDCLDCLDILIKRNTKGLYCLGETYGENNFLSSNWKISNL